MGFAHRGEVERGEPQHANTRLQRFPVRILDQFDGKITIPGKRS
jgi:hypothetical protein